MIGLARCVWAKTTTVAVLFVLYISEAVTKPNILLIVADDANRQIGHLKIPPYQQSTPNIDDLAKSGVTFTNANACASDCKASRTCLLLSAMPPTTKVVSNKSDIPQKVLDKHESLFQYLNRVGYRNVIINKVAHKKTFLSGHYVYEQFKDKGTFAEDMQFVHPHLDNSLFGTVRNGSLSDTSDGQGVESLIRYIEKHEEFSYPFFYGIGLYTCHFSQHIPDSFMTKVPEDAPMPPRPASDFDDIPAQADTQSGLGATWHRRGQRMVDTPEAARYVRHFYGCLAVIDEFVGQITAAVKQSSKEWIIIFSTDHGFHLLDKNRMAKFTMWPAVTQVPLVIAGGKFTGGRVVDQPVSLADIFPTIAGVVQQPPANPLDGIDLATVVAGTHQRKEVVVYYITARKAVVSKEWHFIQYEDGSMELYDRIGDPWALHNVAHKHPRVTKQLAAAGMLQTTEAYPTEGGQEAFNGTAAGDSKPIETQEMVSRDSGSIQNAQSSAWLAAKTGWLVLLLCPAVAYSPW